MKVAWAVSTGSKYVVELTAVEYNVLAANRIKCKTPDVGHLTTRDDVAATIGAILSEAIADLVPRRCRVCGCTENDCYDCIERTGEPCHWVEPDLCSACVGREKPARRRKKVKR